MTPAGFSRALKNRLQTKPIAKVRCRYRPTLELLEDRMAPAIFTVTNNGDVGPGSLRQAILDANAKVGADTINFNILPAGGIKTINLNSALPTLTDKVTIAGDTQPLFAGFPLIEVNGAAAGVGSNGLVMKAAGSVVRSLIIDGFHGNGILALGPSSVVEGSLIRANDYYGVLITGASTGVRIGSTVSGFGNVINSNALSGVAILGTMTIKNVVEGNYIGTNVLGNGAVANLFDGVVISGGAKNNTIGGTVAGARNVISGNSSNGVEISGAGTTGNLVQGNFIGIDVNGNALGNTVNGVAILAGAANNTIGGTVAGARNVISKNFNGVEITDAGTKGNLVEGNLIGTNSAGTAGLGNTFYGVNILAGAINNTVGGTVAGARNVISGNFAIGVGIADAGTTGNRVLGNYIGTDVNGSAAVPNINIGVAIGNSAASNTVGGTVAGARNLISGNNGAGVKITGPGTTKNLVQGNYIGTDVGGTADLGNADDGVLIDNGAASNTVGGTVASARNIISGNNGHGVDITDAGTKSNTVAGNFIGTNAAGTAQLGNSFNGVAIFNGATDNVVGGSVAGARNVISGNQLQGVLISDAGTKNNGVGGNFIGTNAAGTAALGNKFEGVLIRLGAASNFIGLIGAAVSARNVISGNGQCGILIMNANTNKNFLLENYIGLAANGTTPLGNTSNGVFITDSAAGNILDANTIAYNGGDGVLIGSDPPVFPNAAGSGNAVVINSIFNNLGIGIDLGPHDGPTPNDVNDVDAGPNDLLNTPVITSAFLSGTTLQITGFINTEANKDMLLQFFANPTGGQGQTFVGYLEVKTGSNNTAFFTATLTVPKSVLKGYTLTALTTEMDMGSASSTSEFSLPVTIE